ncbi:MAG TPA: 6-phosphogluconolactonase [Burkholderiaceae bacterium]|nr:6-phosphogluconolactonase [Burkholderiaceae bacterium]
MNSTAFAIGKQSLHVRHFASMDEMAAVVAELAREALAEAIEVRGAASLVVSGGTTPAGYFPRLAALPLAWERVTITLADERWVTATDEASNERLARDHLLQGPAARARFIGLKTPAPTPQEGAAAAAAALDALARPYDLVLLGMGHDGHFASLFPGAPELARGLAGAESARCIAITPPAHARPSVPRISLTLAELTRARRIVVALQGAGKRATLDHALASAQRLNGSAGESLPIAALFARANVEVMLAD